MPETPEAVEFEPVPAPPVQPEDQLRDELLPPLSEDDERELWRAVTSDQQAALLDRMPWESNLATWENQYLGRLPEKTFPWSGCANFHVPLTMVGIETLKPRLVESVLGGDPMIMVLPVEPADEVRRDRVELFLNWQARTQLSVEPLIEESAHLILNPGTVVAKILWRTDQRKVKRLASFPPETPPEQIFQALFGDDVPELKPAGELRWDGEVSVKHGTPRKVKVRLKALEREIQALVERDEVTYDGARIELIDPLDFILPQHGGNDVQRLPWCQHRLWLTEYELRLKVRQGRFDADAVEALLRGQAPAGENTQQDGREIREVRSQSEGVETDAGSSVRDTQYEVLEDYRRWDIDSDGQEEEIVCWVACQLPDRLLGWDYLDNVYAHGRRPFVVGQYLKLPGRAYGLSFPQVIQGVQEEINTIHNQRVDAGTLQNTPAYFFRGSSTHDPRVMRLAPGQGIPIDNPQQDVLMVQWGGNPVFGQNEEALLYQYFERLTGLTDLALGRQPNRVGATRTATGVASLLSEAGLRFKNAMLSFQRFWAECFEHVLALDQQLLQPGLEFRVTGRWPEVIALKDRSEIQGRYDLRIAATTETMNKQVMREDATVKLTTALNPIALQAGVVGLKGIRRLYRQFFRAYGETDPDLIVEPERENEVVMTPEQELGLFLAGQDRKPSMLENLAQHYEEHVQQRQDEMVQEKLGPAGLAKLDQHIAETLQLMQMQMMAQMLAQGGGKQRAPGQGAPVGRQALNAQTGKYAPNQPSQFGNGTMALQTT